MRPQRRPSPSPGEGVKEGLEGLSSRTLEPGSLSDGRWAGFRAFRHKLASMWPGPFSPTAGTYGNLPLPPRPPRPEPWKSQDVDRHLGLRCLCPLIDCCHDEDTDEGDRWRVAPDLYGCGSGVHVHSGSPVSGYTQPWEPGDESWQDVDVVYAVTALGGRNIRPAW